MTPVDPTYPIYNVGGDISASDNSMKMTRDLGQLYAGEPEVSASKRSSTPKPVLLTSAEVPIGTFTSSGGSASANVPEGASEEMRRDIIKLRAEIEKDASKAKTERAHIETSFEGLTADHTALKTELTQRGQ